MEQTHRQGRWGREGLSAGSRERRNLQGRKISSRKCHETIGKCWDDDGQGYGGNVSEQVGEGAIVVEIMAAFHEDGRG